MAHQISFSSADDILTMVHLMEHGGFGMLHIAGNRYPSIYFPDDGPKREYSHGDYIVFDDELCKWYGQYKDEFESKWGDVK